MSAISEARLRPIIDKSVEASPDYWYGVMHEGTLWHELFVFHHDAAKLAKAMNGMVVVVAARVLEDADGVPIEVIN